MRAALGMAVMAVCLASQPALAGTGATSRGSASLQSLPGDAAKVRRTTAVTPDLRIRFDAVIPVDGDTLLGGPDPLLRQRLATAMMEYYPSGHGLHFSAGIRMFERTNFLRDADLATHGLLYNPRGMNADGVRAGFRRYTPAVAMGYSRDVARGLTIGLEGGAMMGRANNSMPRSFRLAATGSSDERNGFNPIANMVVGWHF